MAALIITLIVLVAGIFLFLSRPKKRPVVVPPEMIEDTLNKQVAYYARLSPEEKQRFQKEVDEFIREVRITGVQTDVTDEDRVLLAASAVIPICSCAGCIFPNLHEVLVYHCIFDDTFSLDEANTDRNIQGMVGTGAMHRMMIISRSSLRNGFANKTDKENTAIHEFVHLIDKTDGAIDGVPELLLDKQIVHPWLKLMLEEIQAIKENESDINPYGATNEAEFFAVASEYFFERPELFKEKNPALYALMEKIFRQRPATDNSGKHDPL
ncbi:MAG TPA: M90 family metallopeptidase [Phnomibacter sp.]|nr:M90 family metallopeptidase [Phnomibacter sp.]